MTTLHPSAPASRIAHARQALLRRLMMAFQPRSAQKARTRISRSEPNCRLPVSSCILTSGAVGGGGSTRSNLLAPERAELGRRSSCGVESCIGGVFTGSSANEDERDDMRERDGMSGERGGAKPVMQSMTSTRWGRFANEVFDDTLLDLPCDGGPLMRSLMRSSRDVEAGRFMRSRR